MTMHAEHDYEPVRIHVVSSDVPMGGAASGQRKRIVTSFGSETVDATNTVRALLPDAPDRVCAYVQVTGGDVYLCDSESKAKQAIPLGAVLPKANTAPWPLRGQQGVWIANAGTVTCTVSFTADYEVGR